MPRPRKRREQYSRTPEPPRYRRWKVALAEADTREADWARAHCWTPSHVAQVVRGKRESAPTLDVVMAFIEAQERALFARLSHQLAA